MIKAVIFDMDGLMFDTERIMKEGWKIASRELGFLLTDSQLDQMRGSTRDRNCRLFLDWFQGTVSYDEGRSIRTRHLEEMIQKDGVPLKKGLTELLDYLNKKQIPAAIATSTKRSLASHYWDMAKVSEFFAASVCGDEITNGKPDPEIFLTAAGKLGISPQDCLVLEDSINGILAGNAAGCHVGMIPDLTQPNEALEKLCDFIYEDLSLVIPFLHGGSPLQFP